MGNDVKDVLVRGEIVEDCRERVDLAQLSEADLLSVAKALQVLCTERRIRHNKLLASSRRKTYTDALTGFLNRRAFDEDIRSEVARAKREGGQTVLVMIDIDRFKSVNDQYGHAAGDELLKCFARILKSRLRRSTDRCYRYGGEEFAILVPNARLEKIPDFIEKVRSEVEVDLQIQVSSEMVARTASFGVAEWKRIETPVEFLKRADAALYRAKNTGRNRVVFA